MYVCICIHIYIYTHTHIHTYMLLVLLVLVLISVISTSIVRAGRHDAEGRPEVLVVEDLVSPESELIVVFMFEISYSFVT